LGISQYPTVLNYSLLDGLTNAFDEIIMVIGRFAPTPSGPLHFGSLIAALGSFLHSRSKGGEWLIRIDDLDTVRTIPGMDAEILRTLEHFSLTWDGEVLYQSSRTSFYQEIIEQFIKQGVIYPCSCSRKEVSGSPYPGTCRNGPSSKRAARSLRIRTTDQLIQFHDQVQGEFGQILETETGDFIIKRADGFVAYHLATVVDDASQGVTEVVRGADLLDSTPRQIYLQKLLEYSQLEYTHLPVATDETGQKLSKSNGTLALDTKRSPGYYLYLALVFLGQNPPQDLQYEKSKTCIEWGLKHWDIDRIPAQSSRPSNALSSTENHSETG